MKAIHLTAYGNPAQWRRLTSRFGFGHIIIVPAQVYPGDRESLFWRSWKSNLESGEIKPCPKIRDADIGRRLAPTH